MPCDFSAVCGIVESSDRVQGDVTLSHRLWHRLRSPLWLGCGVVHGGYIYVHNMHSVVQCPELVTGEVRREERTNSSIAASNGELFVRIHESLWCISPEKPVPPHFRHTSNAFIGKSWRILTRTLSFNHKFPRDCQNIFPITGREVSPFDASSFTQLREAR